MSDIVVIIRRASLRIMLALIIAMGLASPISPAEAHPGNTASDGGHYCWTNCDSWGEVYGERHFHGGGSYQEEEIIPEEPDYYDEEDSYDSSASSDTEESSDIEQSDQTGDDSSATEASSDEEDNSIWWIVGGIGLIGWIIYEGNNGK